MWAPGCGQGRHTGSGSTQPLSAMLPPRVASTFLPSLHVDRSALLSPAPDHALVKVYRRIGF
ncbi:hypothetical protein LY78DRAFT_658133 [Colletotrichum sublineola]|nr:hypothetical protein LY78DRAFT_658133 [Colletotrichum sublineola]